MELSILLAQQIVSLFLYVAAGYVTVKVGIMKSEDSKIISNMIVYICSPCAIITAFQIELTQEKLQGLMLAFGAAILLHILMIGGTWLLGKVLHFNSIEKVSIVYTNAGNLIIPLVSAVLGEEWVFYTTAFIIVQTLLTWTHCLHIIDSQAKMDYKDILLNPNIIAILIGFFLFIMRIQIPQIVDTCVDGFGAMIGTAGMFVIGMVIGNLKLSYVFTRKRPYLICFIRLIVFPVISTLIFALVEHLGLHKDAEYILMVVLLAESAPAAAIVTQIAQIYDADSRYASVINVMSIVFCIVTMPLIVMLYEMLI